MHAKILTSFCKNFPNHVQAMKTADHHYDNMNLNPYHMEGDVWTHTMMVYSEAIKTGASIEILMAALLHDVGKPQARNVNHERKRVQFFGHEGISFYKAIDILNHECFGFMSKQSKLKTLKFIALHSELFDWKNSKNDNKFVNDGEFLNDLMLVATNDIKGRICLLPDNMVCDFKPVKIIQTVPEPKMNQITILIGPSNSGKSTYISGSNDIIISRDDLVMNIGTGTTYNECWKSVNQSEVDRELMKKFQQAIKNNKNIIVDMTNTSKKTRRKWLNGTNMNTYWKKAVVFNTGYAELHRRAQVQSKIKNIPAHVIDNMVRSFSFPMFDEFDEIAQVEF